MDGLLLTNKQAIACYVEILCRLQLNRIFISKTNCPKSRFRIQNYRIELHIFIVNFLCIAHISILLYCFTVVVPKLPALSILISETESSQMVSFGCFAADFTPKDYTITWLRNGEKIDQPQISTSSEGKKNENGTFYDAASYIQVGENRWKDAGANITCTFANGKEHVEAHVNYDSRCGSEGE